MSDMQKQSNETKRTTEESWVKTQEQVHQAIYNAVGTDGLKTFVHNKDMIAATEKMLSDTDKDPEKLKEFETALKTKYVNDKRDEAHALRERQLANLKTPEFTADELVAAYTHLESEIGAELASQLKSTTDCEKLTTTIARQRRELAKAGIVSAEDPYPKATLNLNEWGIVNPAFKRRGAGYSLEENEALLNHYMKAVANPANRDKFKAKPDYESRLADACSYLRGGRVHKSALEDIGISGQERWKIEQAITKERVDEAKKQSTLETDAASTEVPSTKGIEAGGITRENLKSPDFGII